MIEILMVVGIMGILMAMGLPRLGKARDRGAVRSARQQVGAYIATARAAAIRRGRPARFHADSNKIWVAATENGVVSILSPKIPLDESFNVTLTKTADSIVYDSRGMAMNLATIQRFKVTRGEHADSVCVTRLGMIQPTCGL